MSMMPDDETLPTDEPVTAPDTEAKPARRRRAAKASEPPPASDAAAESGDPVAALAPARVRRRKAGAATQAATSSESGPGPDVGPATPGQVIAPDPTDATPPKVEVPAPIVPEPVAAIESAPHARDTTAEPGDESAGGADGPGADRSSRGRRRNRRNRRGDRGDGPPVSPAGVEEGAAAAPQAVDAGERFAEVLSGEFDTALEGDTAAAAGPDVETKRVLAPEPDAPKLHKVLAQAGIGSRRDMEAMILEGRITVNGQPAHIGQRISWGDQIKVGGKPVKVRIQPPPPRVLAYHKPAGEVVTHDDPQNRPTVFRRLPRLQQGKWQSVGRLDINTEGLLLFTNSGELANQLMHPRFGVEREYAVRVLGALDDEARERLLAGIEIDGQAASFKSIEDGGGDGANRWYRVVITEGRNREVRKLFDAVGLAVSRLIRIRYGCVVLPQGLKRGMWVDLGEGDVRAIRRLASPGPRGEEQGGRGGRNRKQRGGRGPDRGRERPPEPPQQHAQRRVPDGDLDHDDEFDDHHGPIPNPLEQTFDKRFVQNPRSSVGGRGFGRGGGGFGPGGSSPHPGGPRKAKGGGPREPDPMQTSVGYIGGDAFHRKRGGRRGGGFGGGR